jgi:hypothetical protein
MRAQFNLDSLVCYFVRLNRLRTGPACDLREARSSWTSYRVNTWTRAVGRSFAGSILQRSGFRAKPIAPPSLRPMGGPARIDHPKWIH